MRACCAIESRARLLSGVIAALVVLGAESCSTPEAARQAARAVDEVAPMDTRAAWVRLTPAGMAALTTRVRTQLGTRIVPLPSTSQGDLSVCASGRCTAALTPEALTISVRPDGALRLDASLVLEAHSLPVRYQRRWPCAFQSEPLCAAHLDTRRGPRRALQVELPLWFEAEAPRSGQRLRDGGGLLSLRAGLPALAAGIEGDDLGVEGANECGRAYCAVAGLPPVRALIAERVNAAIGAEVARAVEPITCQPCELGCERDARCVSGVCQRAGGGCQGRTLGAAVEVRSEAGVDWRLSVAGADVASARLGGVEAALRVTSRSSRRDACVPVADPPSARAVPREAFDLGMDGEAHVRLLIGESALSRAAWAAEQGGLLCRRVSAQQLPAWAIDLALPSYARLRAAGAGPLDIAIEPLAAPTVEILPSGAIAVHLRALRVSLRAPLGGTMHELAQAKGSLRATFSLELEGASLHARIDRSAVVVGIDAVSTSTALGLSEHTQRSSFSLLAKAAVATLPERVLLTDGLPADLELVAPPARRTHGDVRALELALRLRSR